MDIPTKEILKSIYFTLNKSIDDIIIELILCFQYGKSLTESDLSSKQKKTIAIIWRNQVYNKIN